MTDASTRFRATQISSVGQGRAHAWVARSNGFAGCRSGAWTSTSRSSTSP